MFFNMVILMNTHNIKKENHPKLLQICSYGIFSKGLKNEFETAVVNEPSVFEPLKVFCTSSTSLKIKCPNLLKDLTNF